MIDESDFSTERPKTVTTEHVRGIYADVSLIRERDFNAWLASVKAKAWHEGYANGYDDAYCEKPYREGT